ncbi:TPM domain-containing protein, partial [Clostridium perfringens]|nr:TPM domain-containing protein [Clostridium perfringens]
WKLGQKGKDNGVLVIVAPDDRRMRIEVGYGLEGTLTDAQAARIIRDRMTGFFKAGRYDDGVVAGVDAIVATLEGRAADAAPASAEPRKTGGFL